jgi:very-short-patch-repair endonuclease
VQVSATGVERPYGEQADHLVTTADSDLEQEFIRFLEQHGLHLPESHHVRIESAMTEPDFLYPGHHVAVYIDGPAHEYPDRQQRDAEQTAAMRDLGWTVLRFGHKDDWAQLVDSYRWVFGEVA